MSDADGLSPGVDRAFCGACGARLEVSDRFCTSCGESQERFLEAATGPASDEAGTAVLDVEASAPGAGGEDPVEEPTLVDVAPVAGLPPPVGQPLSELPPPSPRASRGPSAAPAPARARVAPPKRSQVTGAVVLGYALAIVLPLFGAVVGGALHRGNRHGVRIVVLSLAVMALFAAGAVALLVALGIEVANTSAY